MNERIEIRRNNRILSVELLETRAMLDGVGVVSGTTFAFVDNGGNDTNSLTATIVGGDLVLHDANFAITAGPGTTQIDGNTISAPLANFDTFFADLKGGDDSLALPAAMTETAVVQGGEGNDTIIGGGGADVILGDNGDDVLSGAGGADVIFGGFGADTISGNEGMDVLIGWEGNLMDIPGSLMNVGADTSNDTISGGEDGDVIRGGLGNDTLSGGGGGDNITGDDGADTLAGGSENDTILGGAGNDTILGEDGDDSLLGEGNDDLIDGGSGNDTAVGGEGADIIFGGFGNDTLTGDAGADQIVGWEGNLADVPGSLANVGTDAGDDTIVGGSEGDFLAGGLGNDVVVGEGGADVITGNGGADFLSGGDDGDVLNGGADNDTITGEGGNDTIVGEAGQDLIEAGEGDDSVDAGADDDIVFGGFGNDTIVGGQGNDFIVGWEGNLADIGGSLTTVGADTGNDDISGDAGLDTLHGGLGNDLIDGGADGDMLFGEDGDDTLFGGLGDDTISGGAGIDIAVGWELNRADIPGSIANVGADVGNDVIAGGADGDVLRGGFGADIISGEGGGDIITGDDDGDFLAGGDDGDLISGGAGNDTITGDAGNDTIQGEAGQDVIEAGADDDNVNAGTEDDIVFGGLGNDTIVGGAGNDFIVGWEGDLSDIVNSLANVGADTGNDDISGNEGLDNLHGGLGNDFIDGGDDNDMIFGDGGNDIVEAGAGDDTISGGEGDDLLGGFTGNDVIAPGPGSDFVFADSTYDRAGTPTSADPALHGNDVIVWLDGDGTDFLFGEGGTDVAQVLLGAGAIPATGLFINMGTQPAPTRDNIFVSATGQRAPVFSYLAGGEPAALVISGLGGAIVTSESETINYGDFSDAPVNDDQATVVGTLVDDDITVASVSASQALVFLGGDPWDGPAEGSAFDQFPGVAGGSLGPDLNITSLAPSAANVNPLTINGGGANVQGDRLYIYGKSEGDLVDAATAAGGVDPFGFGAGVIVPGSTNAVVPRPTAFDTIIATDAEVNILNNGALLVPVDIATASFAQVDMARKALIVNSGFEAQPAANGIADDIIAALSFTFGIQINGGDPDPFLSPADQIPPRGDRLQVFAPAEINIFSDKSTPPVVNFNSGGSKNMSFTSIETIVLTPGNGSREVNIYGDNNDPAVDQNDNYVVRGRNIDSNLGPIDGAPPQFQPDPDGANEFTLELNGSVPISFRNVQFLNAFGDDQALTPSVGPNDIDTLDISPYVDNTAIGWGIDVAFNEGNPAQADGAQADLLIYRTSIFGKAANENIVATPAGPENGKVIATNGANGSLIVDIDYSNNLDIIVSDDDGSPSDADNLTLKGTDSSNPQTSGKDIVTANLTAAGDLNNPLVVVSDAAPKTAGAPLLYRIRDIVGITTLNIDTLSGNDVINVTPSPDITVNVDGGTPNGSITGIGDILNLVTPDPFVFQKGADPSSGTFFVGANAPISFKNIEGLQRMGEAYRPPGPRVKNVTISGNPNYSLFEPNPNEGPTPLFNMLDVTFVASQFGLAGLDAVDQALALTAGNYSLVGDKVGPVFVQSVQLVMSDTTGDPMLTVKLTFSQFLPDDRYTFTIQDDITDPLGNRLDGDVRGTAGPGGIFPSGDGNPGTDFVARFTVDARPEVGVYISPNIYIDANGNTVVDPLGSGDASNRDLHFLMQHEDADGNLLPGGFGLHDTLFAGKFGTGGLVVGGQPDVIFIVDVSGSTTSGFGGTPVGDLNGDGSSNTILDAEIAGFIALTNDLVSRGLGDTADIVIVPFSSSATFLDMDPLTAGLQISTSPNADADNNGVPDVIQALATLQSGGGTEFESPLQLAISALDQLSTATGNGNVIFLSDGFGSGSFQDEVDEIRNVRGQNLRAFGVGTGSSLDQLLLIDPDAVQVTTTDEILDALGGGGSSGGGRATGFDTLAAYGFFGGGMRWIIDMNGDGVVRPSSGDIYSLQPPVAGVDIRSGLPVAGNFNGSSGDGDEIGLFDGVYWLLDSNGDDVLDDTDTKITSIISGLPIVGDFDGDGLDDLGAWKEDVFRFDLANDGLGTGPVRTIGFGIPGIAQLPVAADMDADGIDDIGLFNYATDEWSFLLSNKIGVPHVAGSLAPLTHTFSPQNVGGKDLFFHYGVGRTSLPIVGNFSSNPLASEDEPEPAPGLQGLALSLASAFGEASTGDAVVEDPANALAPVAGGESSDSAAVVASSTASAWEGNTDESAVDELFDELADCGLSDHFLSHLRKLSIL